MPRVNEWAPLSQVPAECVLEAANAPYTQRTSHTDSHTGGGGGGGDDGTHNHTLSAGSNTRHRHKHKHASQHHHHHHRRHVQHSHRGDARSSEGGKGEERRTEDRDNAESTRHIKRSSSGSSGSSGSRRVRGDDEISASEKVGIEANNKGAVGVSSNEGQHQTQNPQHHRVSNSSPPKAFTEAAASPTRLSAREEEQERAERAKMAALLAQRQRRLDAWAADAEQNNKNGSVSPERTAAAAAAAAAATAPCRRSLSQLSHNKRKSATVRAPDDSPLLVRTPERRRTDPAGPQTTERSPGSRTHDHGTLASPSAAAATRNGAPSLHATPPPRQKRAGETPYVSATLQERERVVMVVDALVRSAGQAAASAVRERRERRQEEEKEKKLQQQQQQLQEVTTGQQKSEGQNGEGRRQRSVSCSSTPSPAAPAPAAAAAAADAAPSGRSGAGGDTSSAKRSGAADPPATAQASNTTARAAEATTNGELTSSSAPRRLSGLPLRRRPPASTATSGAVDKELPCAAAPRPTMVRESESIHRSSDSDTSSSSSSSDSSGTSDTTTTSTSTSTTSTSTSTTSTTASSSASSAESSTRDTTALSTGARPPNNDYRRNDSSSNRSGAAVVVVVPPSIDVTPIRRRRASPDGPGTPTPPPPPPPAAPVMMSEEEEGQPESWTATPAATTPPQRARGRAPAEGTRGAVGNTAEEEEEEEGWEGTVYGSPDGAGASAAAAAMAAALDIIASPPPTAATAAAAAADGFGEQPSRVGESTSEKRSTGAHRQTAGDTTSTTTSATDASKWSDSVAEVSNSAAGAAAAPANTNADISQIDVEFSCIDDNDGDHRNMGTRRHAGSCDTSNCTEDDGVNDENDENDDDDDDSPAARAVAEAMRPLLYLLSDAGGDAPRKDRGDGMSGHPFREGNDMNGSFASSPTLREGRARLAELQRAWRQHQRDARSAARAAAKAEERAAAAHAERLSSLARRAAQHRQILQARLSAAERDAAAQRVRAARAAIAREASRLRAEATAASAAAARETLAARVGDLAAAVRSHLPHNGTLLPREEEEEELLEACRRAVEAAAAASDAEARVLVGRLETLELRNRVAAAERRLREAEQQRRQRRQQQEACAPMRSVVVMRPPRPLWRLFPLTTADAKRANTSEQATGGRWCATHGYRVITESGGGRVTLEGPGRRLAGTLPHQEPQRWRHTRCVDAVYPSETHTSSVGMPPIKSENDGRDGDDDGGDDAGAVSGTAVARESATASPQALLFERELAPLLEAWARRGAPLAVIVTGPAGAGKTYTLVGDDSGAAAEAAQASPAPAAGKKTGHDDIDKMDAEEEKKAASPTPGAGRRSHSKPSEAATPAGSSHAGLPPHHTEGISPVSGAEWFVSRHGPSAADNTQPPPQEVLTRLRGAAAAAAVRAQDAAAAQAASASGREDALWAAACGLGPAEGLLPRAVAWVTRRLLSPLPHEPRLRAGRLSVCEVYLGRVYDLLAPPLTPEELAAALTPRWDFPVDRRAVVNPGGLRECNEGVVCRQRPGDAEGRPGSGRHHPSRHGNGVLGAEEEEEVLLPGPAGSALPAASAVAVESAWDALECLQAALRRRRERHTGRGPRAGRGHLVVRLWASVAAEGDGSAGAGASAPPASASASPLLGRRLPPIVLCEVAGQEQRMPMRQDGTGGEGPSSLTTSPSPKSRRPYSGTNAATTTAEEEEIADAHRTHAALSDVLAALARRQRRQQQQQQEAVGAAAAPPGSAGPSAGAVIPAATAQMEDSVAMTELEAAAAVRRAVLREWGVGTPGGASTPQQPPAATVSAASPPRSGANATFAVAPAVLLPCPTASSAAAGVTAAAAQKALSDLRFMRADAQTGRERQHQASEKYRGDDGRGTEATLDTAFAAAAADDDNGDIGDANRTKTASDAEYIPFRASRLTRLLEPILGGGSGSSSGGSSGPSSGAAGGAPRHTSTSSRASSPPLAAAPSVRGGVSLLSPPPQVLLVTCLRPCAVCEAPLPDDVLADEMAAAASAGRAATASPHCYASPSSSLPGAAATAGGKKRSRGKGAGTDGGGGGPLWEGSARVQRNILKEQELYYRAVAAPLLMRELRAALDLASAFSSSSASASSFSSAAATAGVSGTHDLVGGSPGRLRESRLLQLEETGELA